MSSSTETAESPCTEALAEALAEPPSLMSEGGEERARDNGPAQLGIAGEPTSEPARGPAKECCADALVGTSIMLALERVALDAPAQPKRGAATSGVGAAAAACMGTTPLAGDGCSIGMDEHEGALG